MLLRPAPESDDDICRESWSAGHGLISGLWLVVQGDVHMSTVTREPGAARTAPALPSMARGDAIFGTVAVVIGLLALVAKLCGIFG